MAAVVENTPLNYAVECLKDPWEDYGDEDLGLVDIFYEEGFPFVIRTSGEDEEEEEESDEKEEECDDDEETEIDDDDGAKVFVEVRFNPNEREYLTEEESKRYMRQMLESEGFDVDLFPDVVIKGLIGPDILDRFRLRSVVPLAKLSIENYNELWGGSFEFEEIEKVNSQFTWNLTYYITFKANENGRAGEIVAFQSRVVHSLIFQIRPIVVFAG